MMDSVTGRNRESSPGFRANPPIWGAARRPCRRMTASKYNATAPSKTMAMRRRRTPAEYAVIIALISIASSVVGATQLPVTTWPRSERAHLAVNEPIHLVTVAMHHSASCANELRKPPPTSNVIAAPAAWHESALDEAYAAEHEGQGQPASGGRSTLLIAVVRPAPSGEVTPTPPQIPAPTLKPTAPPVATSPPQAEQPLPPPRQQHRPPPPQQAPAPEPEAPPPSQEAPAPEPEAPPPPQQAPAPEPEAPPPPGRGRVQLAP
jgi:hypothetical protein